MTRDIINKSVLLLLLIGITALFLSMISQFLLAIFLAGLASAMMAPLYRRLTDVLWGNRYLASATTLLLLLTVVLIPLLILIGIIVAQAVNVGESVIPLISTALKNPGTFRDYLSQLPFYDEVTPYLDDITAALAEGLNALGKLLVGGLSSVAIGTVNFLFMTLVFFYTLFFLQMDGAKLVERILYYLPLDDHDERQLLDKFTSVTRAMVKGTLLIGLIQGTLAGLAFAVVGLDNAVFWGTVMAVLSIIPSIGSAVIWIPASIALVAQGHTGSGIGLALFCGLVVGGIDNVLRPLLVGRDTNMHELMIFFGTLGGLFMFGMSGLLIGPLIASLFITVWQIYGVAFANVLPAVGSTFKAEDESVTEPAAEEPVAEEPAENDRST